MRWRDAGTRIGTTALLVLRAAAVAMAVTLGPLVAAQGFRMGLASALPGPVSSLDLSRYGSMMNLTPEQMRAWSDMHERYKNDFKTLGESGGAIAAFIEARKPVEGIPYRRQPPPAEVGKWLSAHQSAMNAIKTLDDRLFDELTPLLIQEQQSLLQRAKMARERARISGDELVQQWLDSSREADLCEMFAKIEADAGGEIAAEQRAAAWAVLDGYQSQYVAKLRALQESACNVYRDLTKMLADAGVPPNSVDTAKSETLDRELFKKVVLAWTAANQKVLPQPEELARLNRAKQRAVAEQLPPKQAWLFNSEFWQNTLFDNAFNDIEVSDVHFQWALAIPDLKPEERDAILAMRTDFRAKSQNLIDAFSEAQDLMQAQRTPAAPVARPEDSQRVQEARQRMTQALLDAHIALQGLVGRDRLRAHFSGNRDERLRVMLRENGVDDEDEIADLLAQYHGGKPIVLGPRSTIENPLADAISPADVESLSGALHWTPEQRETVRKLQAAYAHQYRERFDAASRAIAELAIGGWKQRGADGRASAAPPEDVQKAVALERAAIQGLRQLDSAFFNDAQAALNLQAEALWRARLAREWALLARGPRPGSNELRTYEGYVLLRTWVDRLSLAEEEAAKADEVFLARADEIRAAAQAHFEANRDAWAARHACEGHADGPIRSTPEVIQQKEREAIEAEAKADQKRAALITLNRSLLEQLTAALPAHADELRDRYERAAFPRVFKDASDAGPLLAKALTLKDLSDSARNNLQDAAAKFQPAYREACQRMIAVNNEWDSQTRYTEAGQKARDAAKYRWDQLLFERNELNAAARATLLRVLTPEQRAALGLLETTDRHE